MESTGNITRERIEKALDYLSDEIKSFSTEDYALITDIVLFLSREDYMSATRAMDILDDAKKIIPCISELRLL